MRHKKAKLQQQASLLEMFDFRLFVPICVHTRDMTVWDSSHLSFPQSYNNKWLYRVLAGNKFNTKFSWVSHIEIPKPKLQWHDSGDVSKYFMKAKEFLWWCLP